MRWWAQAAPKGQRVCRSCFHPTKQLIADAEAAALQLHGSTLHSVGNASLSDFAHLVKAPSHGLVEAVGQVGGTQHQHSRVRGIDALHLDQELGLDAPRRLALALPARAAQRIDLRVHDDAQSAPAVQLDCIVWQF